MSTTIGSLVSPVASLLGNRTDLASKITEWIKGGYYDLATTIPFETLEESESTQTISGIDSYDYPEGARAIKDLTIYISNAPRTLFKRNMKIIRQYQRLNSSVPSIWAPFGGQFYLRGVPNGAYPLDIDFWKWPTIATVVNNTVIQLPPDWIEIVTYEAQMRGYIDLQEPDKAASIRTLLYGNPMKPGMPGLIKQRLTRIQAEYQDANYGMRPRTTRYTNVR